ncbi:hypothetical protein [Dyella terrae]|uniref:hypothetical protein n=1 Tax=Dyella terrae TaxID=522259 RepID=UPI001EFD2B01|nr:hypothetical protein [Dyella terrae]ULU24950.1 Major outer membrane lipoprotein Lpp [Dyella terrae]
MKNKTLLLAAVIFATALAGCSTAWDMPLAEIDRPENAKQLIKSLAPADRRALAEYVAMHSKCGDLDYKMTVWRALRAQQREASKGVTAKNPACAIQ